MSLLITALNSGSNGNCYYIGNHSEAVLVDAGLSCRETEKRLARLQLRMDNVKALFVSHEHSDHIKGISVIAGKYKIPVYITPPTLVNGKLLLDSQSVRTFQAYQPINIGALTITPFPKFHDACDPFSFIISSGSVTIGVFTDIGEPCEHVIRHFKQCHAAFLESNYDEALLENGPYPYHLKKRISGQKGHLSNKQALDLFVNHKPAFMSHLFLSHLSKDNNCPDLVQSLFNQHAGKTEIIVATRYKETPVYEIRNTSIAAEASSSRKAVSITQLQFEFN